MKRIAVVYGTRPESIKLAPVIMELKKVPNIEVLVVVTAQHREMLDMMNRIFGITPDVDFDLMRERQSLEDLSSRALKRLSSLYEEVEPDVVMVQGDTTTAFISALAAFYKRIPVAHVEAGLRTNDKYSPFPEEINRRLISHLATFHFAPTGKAAENLAREGITENVWITGNTVVDALLWMTKERRAELDTAFSKFLPNFNCGSRVLLLTMHRRENWGEPMKKALKAIRQVVEKEDDLLMVYPVHPNPVVKKIAFEVLKGVPNIVLTDPLDYLTLIAVMSRSCAILTDSGGIQEEAPSFGVPVLVLRETTERPELIENGFGKLVGTDPVRITEELKKLLRGEFSPEGKGNPFGDGKASKRIIEALVSHFR